MKQAYTPFFLSLITVLQVYTITLPLYASPTISSKQSPGPDTAFTQAPIPETHQIWLQLYNAQEIGPILLKPMDLISPYRFDLMAKYLYGYYRKNAIQSTWAFDIYAEHLRIWNNFFENEPRKQGLPDFVTSFDRLLDTIAAKGFDPHTSRIPVMQKDVGWKALNGAHRIAACLLYQPEQPIACHAMRKYENPCYPTWNFFKKMDSRYVDAMALQYCQLKKTIKSLIVFPPAQGYTHTIRTILEQDGAIAYEKKVNLSPIGITNFLRMLYGHVPTDDTQNALWHTMKHAHFPDGSGEIIVFIYETHNTQALKTSLATLIAQHALPPDSLYTADSYIQALQIAQTICLQNSVHCINNAAIGTGYSMEHLCNAYAAWLEKNNYNPEHFCIVGNGTLAAYGLRDCHTLHYIAHGYHTNTANPEIHNYEERHTVPASTKDDIIFNPTKHFYYKGLKFASLDTIKQLKEN